MNRAIKLDLIIANPIPLNPNLITCHNSGYIDETSATDMPAIVRTKENLENRYKSNAGKQTGDSYSIKPNSEIKPYST